VRRRRTILIQSYREFVRSNLGIFVEPGAALGHGKGHHACVGAAPFLHRWFLPRSWLFAEDHHGLPLHASIMNALQTASAVVFWVCAILVMYAYLGYPMVVWWLARWFGRQAVAPVAADGELPTVSLLIAAHNEEADIGERLRTALLMDWPADKLEIVVVSDGSTDATPEIVQPFAPRGDF